eukprot:jgi/Mesen1/9146/ME000580S08481
MLMSLSGDSLAALLDKEADLIAHVEAEGPVRIAAAAAKVFTQRNPANWGLDRIDQRAGQSPLNGVYQYSADGRGVHVYVLDTVTAPPLPKGPHSCGTFASALVFAGIRCSHTEFRYADGRKDRRGRPQSRCSGGYNAMMDNIGTADCNGHGSHCAGAHVRTGVAKAALLHPVRAMGCDGNGGYGNIMAGLDWIAGHFVAPAVVSMSITTPVSISLDQAVTNLVNLTGIVAVAAAGNYFSQTCNYSPADNPQGIAVGASNRDDKMSWFSNYGSCTDIFAPGEAITSVGSASDTAFQTMSGTSMACPHVAGAAALFLGLNKDARPNDVRSAIMDAAQPDRVKNLGPSTTGRLLSTNLRSPPVSVKPRSWYGGFEGNTKQTSVVLLRAPARSVTLVPVIADPTIGYFKPLTLTFSPATWNKPRTISLILYRNPGGDANFRVTLEGFIESLDRDVCKPPCGQSRENPKVVPYLPFFYVDDSTNYRDVYNGSNSGACHDSGPDVVFTYTAPFTMVHARAPTPSPACTATPHNISACACSRLRIES